MERVGQWRGWGNGEGGAMERVGQWRGRGNGEGGALCLHFLCGHLLLVITLVSIHTATNDHTNMA